MKRKLLLLLCATTCLLSLLTACGKDTQTDGQSNGNTNVKEESSEGQAENQETLSSAFSIDKNAIWYFIDTSESGTKSLGKDSYPRRYYIFQNGTLAVYGFADETVPYSLGELSKMTDEEIIAALESTRTSNSDNSNSELEICNQAIASVEKLSGYSEQVNDLLAEYGASYTISELKEYLEQYKNLLETASDSDTTRTYSLEGYALYTDSTGNNVVTEGIAYSYDFQDNSAHINVNGIIDLDYIFDDEGYPDINDRLSRCVSYLVWELSISEIPSIGIAGTNVVYIEDISSGLQNAQVYDAWFGGYRCENGYLVTRTEENTKFVFDSLDTPNVMIDPKSDWAKE